MIRLRTLALLAVDAAVLAALRPHFTALGRHLRHPAAWLRAGADRACVEACGAALWFLAGWVAIGLLVTAVSTGSGPSAGLARRICCRLFPAAARHLLATAVGAGLALAPAATAASSPTPSHPPVAVSAAPTPGWPLDPPAAPGPAWPQDEPHDEPPAPRPPTSEKTPQAATEPVTVRPGDSLWLIARRRLGPAATDEQVAAAWPRWYAANRTAVGADPALIRPGQVLHVPADNS